MSPPKKHLRYIDSQNMIVAADGASPTDGYHTSKWTDNSFHGGHIPVFYGSNAQRETVQTAVARWDDYHRYYRPLIRDTRHAVAQLRQLYHERGTVYIAVGGSPKLVKWQLKRDGFSVITVNASGIGKGEPSQEFTEYLSRKLDRFPDQERYVVMDFADTGQSLVTLKRDVENLRKNTDVRAVAIGHSPLLFSDKYEANRKQIQILDKIPDLESALNEQRLKLHVLGRNKEKNPYNDWSADRAGRLAIAPEPTSTIRSPVHHHYQKQKSELPPLMDWPTEEIQMGDLMPQVDSDYGSEYGSDHGSNYGTDYGSDYGEA